MTLTVLNDLFSQGVYMQLSNELQLVYIFECLYENYITVYPTLKDMKLGLSDVLNGSGSADDMSISLCVIDSDVDVKFNKVQSSSQANQTINCVSGHWVSPNKFQVEAQSDVFRVFFSKYLYFNSEDVYCHPDAIDVEQIIMRDHA